LRSWDGRQKTTADHGDDRQKVRPLFFHLQLRPSRICWNALDKLLYWHRHDDPGEATGELPDDTLDKIRVPASETVGFLDSNECQSVTVATVLPLLALPHCGGAGIEL